MMTGMTKQKQQQQQAGTSFFQQPNRDAAVDRVFGVSESVNAPPGAPNIQDDYMLVIPARKRTRRTINLGGVVYRNFRAPKALVSMQMARAGKAAGEDPEAMVEAIASWLSEAFGREEGRAVYERLFDGEDDLDLDAIMDLIAKTMEVEVPDPTG